MLPLRALLIFTAFSFAVHAGEPRVRRNVQVEWDAIEGAISYEVRVTRKGETKKKDQRFKMKDPFWSATIKPGEYLMSIRSLDDRGVPGEWSPESELTVKLPGVIAIYPEANAVVTSKNEATESLTFRWETVPGAAKYKVKARTANGAWSLEKEASQTELDASVPVGQFVNWEVVAVDEKGDDGDKWDAPQSFVLRGPNLKKPEIEAPRSAYIKELKWSANEYAKNYMYDLQYKNPQTKKWEAVEKKEAHVGNVLALDTSRPTGRYRLQVQANGENRGSSGVAKLEFDMMGNFQDPAALDNAILRESITKPTHFYFIASYLITSVSYEAVNNEQLSKGKFGALGGTGRVGGGYQDPESKWGGFGIVDLSGFSIAGENFQFASAEAHVTRKLEFGQGGLLLFGTGLFSKELPYVLGTSVDGYSGVGKARSQGPHAGFTYWVPLSSRFGLQANARAYYTLLGSAPNGGEMRSELSYMGGLMGSYRLGKSWMGYAGYAYRKDAAKFTAVPSALSFAQPGDLNTISLTGHYLNLILEFSF